MHQGPEDQQTRRRFQRGGEVGIPKGNEKPFLSKWILDVEILARFMKLKRKLGHFDVGALLYELPLPEWRDISDSKLRATDLMRGLFDLWP
jgi:hypothetical protein